MRILILNNFFNHYNEIPVFNRKKYFINYYKKYEIIKLKRLIKKIKSRFNEDIKIKVITTGNEKLNINSDINVELLSEFRVDFNRKEYIEITEKVTKEAKKNLVIFLNNLRNLKILHIEGVNFGKLFEFNFITIFNKILREFELLKAILKTEKYDKAIIFNFNSDFSEFIKYIYYKFENIEIYQDLILKKINKRLNWYILNFIILMMLDSFKNSLFNKNRIKKLYPYNENRNIIFFGYEPMKLTYSPFQSIKPIYENLKRNRIFNPIHYYKIFNSIPLNELFKLIKYLLKVRRNYIKNRDKINVNMGYDSIKLESVLKQFYKLDLFKSLISCYTELYHFKQFIKDYPPSIIVTTDKDSASIRLLLNFCKMHNIPSIYIPLSTNVNIKEIVTQTDLTYIIVSGEKEKDYYIRKGEPANKIVVIGRPSYERFYKKKINKLSELHDMFNNRLYKFESNKFTILLNAAIKNFDEKTGEIILTSVFNSLKKFNLLDNLILKLHPMEDGRIHLKLLKKLDYRPIIVRDVNIFELIKSCDLFLSRSSTTIIEAMIIGTPIILLELNNLPYEMSIPHQFLDDKELLLIAKTQDELTELIRNLISNKDLVNRYSKDLIELSKGYSFYDEKEGPIEKIVNLFSKIIE